MRRQNSRDRLCELRFGEAMLHRFIRQLEPDCVTDGECFVRQGVVAIEREEYVESPEHEGGIRGGARDRESIARAGDCLSRPAQRPKRACGGDMAEGLVLEASIPTPI